MREEDDSYGGDFLVDLHGVRALAVGVLERDHLEDAHAEGVDVGAVVVVLGVDLGRADDGVDLVFFWLIFFLLRCDEGRLRTWRHAVWAREEATPPSGGLGIVTGGDASEQQTLARGMWMVEGDDKMVGVESVGIDRWLFCRSIVGDEHL
jgi:hypothetical protein